jgi:hypothetical protein
MRSSKQGEKKIEIAFTFSLVFQYIRATIQRKARIEIKIDSPKKYDRLV